MKAIEIVTIPVKDQQQAKAFYLKLGFEVRIEAPADHGQTWIQMGLPGQEASISLLSFNSIIFETEDIEKEIEDLGAKDIEASKIDIQPWGKFAWIKDPDGNSLCLKQRP